MPTSTATTTSPGSTTSISPATARDWAAKPPAAAGRRAGRGGAPRRRGPQGGQVRGGVTQAVGAGLGRLLQPLTGEDDQLARGAVGKRMSGDRQLLPPVVGGSGSGARRRGAR